MSRNALQMPDWVMPDLSGIAKGAELFNAAQKAKGDQGLEQQKISAANARQQWEQDRAQHQDDVEASSALDPNSPLMRAGSKSAALGNAMGKPYGITFDDQPDAPTMPNAEPAPLDQKSAQFLLGGGQHVDPGQPDPLLDFKPPPEAPAPEPMQGPTPTGAPLSAVPAEPHAEAPGPNLDQELAAREPAVTRSVHASFKGQRFEVPGNEKTSLFDEPKYNSMVDKLVGAGIPEKEAVAQVERVRHADIGEMGKNERFGAGLGQKQNTQLTREERMAEMEAGRAATHTNSVGRDNAIVTAAGLHGGGGPMNYDPKLLNTYNSYSKSAQASALMKQDQQGQRMFDRVAAELDPNNPNPINHTMANHSLAAISVSTGGSAGRVPVSVIHDVQNAYGMATSAKNWLYKQTHGGQNSPEVAATMARAADKLRALSNAERENDYRVWDAKAGHASPWGQATPDLVDAEAASVRAQLHLPPLEQGAAPIPNAVEPPRQHVGGRAPAHGLAPKPIPNAPARSGMVSITNKKTGETKMVTHDEAVRMGAIK